MELRNGRFGPFYGCVDYEAKSCKGSVSAHSDGRLRAIPGNAATRKARFEAMSTIERVRNLVTPERRREITGEMLATYGVVAVGEMTKDEADIIRFKYEHAVGERTVWARLTDEDRSDF